jgi:hypothetical protein
MAIVQRPVIVAIERIRPRATSSSYPLRRTRSRPNSPCSASGRANMDSWPGHNVMGTAFVAAHACCCDDDVADMSDGAIALIDLSSSLPDPCASWGPTRHQMFSDEGTLSLQPAPWSREREFESRQSVSV